MTAMPGYDIFQADVLRTFRDSKTGRDVFAGKDIRIRLADIINRIH